MEYENEGGRDGMLYVAGYCPDGMVVPAGQGSSSSDTSDARCDSSRSDAGESPCSTASSEEGLLRLPVILPHGFSPMQYPVRVTHRNGMKLLKPGDPGGVYYVRPPNDPAQPHFMQQPTGMKFMRPAGPMCADGGVYYMKQPGDGMQAMPQSNGMEFVKPAPENMAGEGGFYYMKPQNTGHMPQNLPQVNGMKLIRAGDPVCVDGNMYYVKPQGDAHDPPQPMAQLNGMRFMKPGETISPDGQMFQVKSPSDNSMAVAQHSGVKLMKAGDSVYGGGNMYYVKPQSVGPMPMTQPVFQTNGMKLVRADEGAMYYMKAAMGDGQMAMPVQPALPTPAPHPVPVGWKRLLVENSIIYLSPSNVALSSIDQVKLYLQSSGTCKCGLQCRVRVENDFNFNPKVPSRPWDSSDAEMTKLCNHKRKVPQITSDALPPLKRKKRKASPYAGVSVSQLLAQRERERAIAAQVQDAAAVAARVARPLPPWQQRVPPLQQHFPPPPLPLVPAVMPGPPPMVERRHKPNKRKLRDQPTFMDDPNGYLAQQTALLHNTITDAGRDSPVTSTVPADPRPIQGGTVSTSEGSPPLVTPPAQSPSSLLVSSSLEPCPPTSKPTARKSPMNVVPSVVTSMAGANTGHHYLVSGAGHYLGGLKLSQPSPVGTVLVNAVPGPFVLQQGMMAMDAAGLGLVTAGNVLVDNPPPLVSPDRKKKGRKRRAPLNSPLMQMPSPVVSQGFAGVLMPGKPVVMNSPINVLQPVVQNLPLQQLLMPGLGNLGNMVMASDGSLLHDPGLNQLQIQPILTNTSVITTPAGMLIRSPNALVGQVSPTEYIQLLPQSSGAVVQQNTTIVQQQTTMMANVDKSQQLEMETTWRNVEKPPLELEIVASHSQQQHQHQQQTTSTSVSTSASVSTQTCGSKETSQAFCQTVASPPPVADTTTADDAISYVTSSVEEKYSVGDESLVSSHSDGGSDVSQTVVSAVPSYIDAEAEHKVKVSLCEGDLVWGAVRGSTAWPGQIIGPITPDGTAIVRWFGSASTASSKVSIADLQTLTEGLDAHHRANNASRRTRKLRAELEIAIQEAMLELDKMGA